MGKSTKVRLCCPKYNMSEDFEIAHAERLLMMPNNIYVTEAAIEEQRVRLQNAETDYKRYAELMKEEAVTPQQFDRVKTDYAATKARYEQLLRQKESSELVKQEQTQRLEQNESDIKLAEAALNLAKLNLSYTVICATANGATGARKWTAWSSR